MSAVKRRHEESLDKHSARITSTILFDDMHMNNQPRREVYNTLQCLPLEHKGRLPIDDVWDDYARFAFGLVIL
jgi:hypothetical protein